MGQSHAASLHDPRKWNFKLKKKKRKRQSKLEEERQKNILIFVSCYVTRMLKKRYLSKEENPQCLIRLSPPKFDETWKAMCYCSVTYKSCIIIRRCQFMRSWCPHWACAVSLVSNVTGPQRQQIKHHARFIFIFTYESCHARSNYLFHLLLCGPK